MKSDGFNDFIAKSGEERIEHQCHALAPPMTDAVTIEAQCANRF